MVELANPGPRKTILRYGLLFGGAGSLAGAVMMTLSILSSSSSTAAIGFIFVPYYALAFWGLPAGIAGSCLGYLHAKRQAGSLAPRPLVIVATVVLLGVVSGGLYLLGEGLLLSSQVSRISQMNAAELESLMSSGSHGKDKFILGAIAQNPHASPQLLHRIATMDDPELHDAMGSLFDLLGENREGLAVMRLIAAHPNTMPATLEILARSPDDYVLGDVARNEKLPEGPLRELANKGGQLIERGVAANPKTPKDILARLAQSNDPYTRALVARNPNAPSNEARPQRGERK